MNSKKIIGILGFLCLWTASGSVAKPPGIPLSKQERAVLHRCILGCFWMERYCKRMPKHQCAEKKQTCLKMCKNLSVLKSVANAPVPAGWGLNKKRAIEVCLVQGEHYFLRDLRCPNGIPPRYQRVGSVGPRNPAPKGTPFRFHDPSTSLGPNDVDTHTIDLYAVTCGTRRTSLYLDMYHCYGFQPWQAPQGFSRPVP